PLPLRHRPLTLVIRHSRGAVSASPNPPGCGGPAEEKRHMTRYQIHNRTSGHILGVWEAESPDTALDAMAREAGYRDYADCQEQVPADDGEIVVTEIPNNILIHRDRLPEYGERPLAGTVRAVVHGLRVTA